MLARKVLKNSIFNSSLVLVKNIGGLIFTIILIRLLVLPDLFGIYNLAISVGFLLFTFADLGINSTAVRYISLAIGKDDKILARSYFVYLLKFKMFLVVFLSIALILFSGIISLYVFNKPELAMPLRIAGIFMFLQSIADFLDSIFTAFQKFEYPLLRHIIFETARLVIAPAFIFLGFSVSGAILGMSLSLVGAFTASVYIFKRHYSYLLSGETTNIDKKGITKFLGYLTIGSLSGVFYGYVDTIMLGIFMEAKYIGFYKAAYMIIFGFMGLISITGILLPVFTQLEGKDLKNALDKISKYSFMLSFPCAIGIAFLAEEMIRLIYGEAYLPALIPLYALVLLILVNPIEIFGVLFTAKGKPEYPTKLGIISSFFNIVLNYILIIKLGMLGAAVATVFSRYFNTIGLFLISKKLFEASLNTAFVYKPLLSSLGMLLLLYSLPKPMDAFSGIVEVGLAAFLYFLILFIINGIGKEDLKYFKLMLGMK
jgi:stage V sporulation protein B